MVNGEKMKFYQMLNQKVMDRQKSRIQSKFMEIYLAVKDRGEPEGLFWEALNEFVDSMELLAKVQEKEGVTRA